MPSNFHQATGSHIKQFEELVHLRQPAEQVRQLDDGERKYPLWQMQVPLFKIKKSADSHP